MTEQSKIATQANQESIIDCNNELNRKQNTQK